MKQLFAIILIIISAAANAQTVTLDGSLSSDQDGSVVAYKWRQISGPAVTLSNVTVVKPTFIPTVAGSYVFGLMVTDNQGLLSPEDSVTITVKAANVRPKADAGPDQTIQLAFLNRNNGKVVENISRITAFRMQ